MKCILSTFYKIKQQVNYIIGYTSNLERRISEHNKDHEWKLVYYEAYLSEIDARKRETKLKNYGQSRTRLNNRIQESLKS